MEDFNKRFARSALSAHDAHRPLRPDEELEDIFSWQETRKVTRSLTLQYKRVTYLLDKTDASRQAMGKHVAIYETEDGDVSIRYNGKQLHARAFAREGHVQQAAIVENKHLAAALQYAKRMQEQRDAKKLAKRGFTKRDKRLLRTQQDDAAQSA